MRQHLLAPGPDETLDSVGSVRILQRRGGYRFTLDAVLLADFAVAGGAPRRAVDLGAGSGVIGLSVATRTPLDALSLVEIQPGLASLSRRNALLNGIDVAHVIEADLRRLSDDAPSGEWDLVLSNPPWFEVGRYRLNPESEKAIARHELACTIADVAHAARRLMTPDGRVAVVLPVHRLSDAFTALAAAELHPSRMRFVHPRVDEPANTFLLEAVTTKRELVVEPPLVVHPEREAPPRCHENHPRPELIDGACGKSRR